jgi:hypothetical protein
MNPLAEAPAGVSALAEDLDSLFAQRPPSAERLHGSRAPVGCGQNDLDPHGRCISSGPSSIHILIQLS